MKCNNCETEMVKAVIYDSDRYRISQVYDDGGKIIGDIYYCPHCGNLQVNLPD